jgi:hypothetical protein
MIGDVMIKSLKKALLLIPAYAGILLFSCIIGVLIYMLYFDTAGLIAGKLLQLFDRHVLFEGFFIIVPVVLVFSGVLLSFYRVRHSGGGILPVIMYALLGAVTWCILYPAFIELKNQWHAKSYTTESVLTAGYFRPSGNNVVYLPHKLVSSDADVVVINRDAAPEDAVSQQKVNYSETVDTAAPFKDILIRETVPTMPEWIMNGFAIIEIRAEHAWNGGYISWLCFISFGLALFSVYALTFCSEWRLINIIYLLLMESGVLSLNLLYFSDYFLPIRKFSLQLGSSLKFFTCLDEPLLVCMNVFLSFIFIGIGTTAVFTRTKNNKRRGI